MHIQELAGCRLAFICQLFEKLLVAWRNVNKDIQLAQCERWPIGMDDADSKNNQRPISIMLPFNPMNDDLRRLSAEEYIAVKNVRQFLLKIVRSIIEIRPDNLERHVVNLLVANPMKSDSLQALPVAAIKSVAKSCDHFTSARRALQPLPGSPTKSRQETVSTDCLGDRPRASTCRRKAPIARCRSGPLVVPKDLETFTELENITRTVDLFAFLQDEQRRLLVGAMRRRELSEGEVVIRQGDPPDNFYIIQTGRLRVLKRQSGDAQVEVAVLERGQYFGELALISGTTRAATVVCDAPSALCWAIDAATYLALLKEHQVQKRQRFRELLRNVPFARGLKPYEILLVSDALRPVSPADGDVIVRQGDIGNDFYIVTDGQCTVKKRTETGDEVEVATLAPGDYFGDAELLTGEPRSATVVARRDTRLVSLRGATFHRLLGPSLLLAKK